MRSTVPFVVLLLAVSPVLAFWLYGRYAAKRYSVEEATVRCRTHDNQLVHLLLVRDRKTGQPVGVRRCSAHANPEDVRCDKRCLPMFEISQIYFPPGEGPCTMKR